MVSIDMEDFNRQVEARMGLIASDLKEALQVKLGKKLPLKGEASGALKSSINVEVIDNEIVITAEEYWKNIEYGTPVGTNVDIEDLKVWALNKFGKSGKEGNAIAYAVAHHIKQHGTMPYPFVRTTLQLDLPEILKDWL